MSGWLRLWIVVSILTLVTSIIITAVEWTQRVPPYVTKADEIRVRWIYNLKDSITNEQDRDNFSYLIASSSWENAPSINRGLFLFGTARELKSAIEVSKILVDEEVQISLRHKYSEQLEIQERWDILRIFIHRFSLVLAWLPGVGLLYLIGWAIGWVRQGFKYH